MWPAVYLPTVTESPQATAEDSHRHEHDNQLPLPFIYQPFSLEAQGPRHVFHERRSSAPPPAVMRLARQSRLEIEVPDASGFESETTDARIGEEGEDSAESRLSSAVGPGGVRIPRERRRSSWAAGAFQAFQARSTSEAYHEAFQPEQLYQQFIQARDAVRRKGQAAGDQERHDGTGRAEGAGTGGAQVSGRGHVGTQQVGDCTISSQPPGDTGSVGCGHAALDPDQVAEKGPAAAMEEPPDSPYSSAVAIAASAACAGEMAQSAQALAAAGISGVAQFGRQQTSRGMHRPPHTSQETVDLQDYYRSPAASSCGTSQRTSPFEGAIATAADCMSYNQLFSKASAQPTQWPMAQSPYRNTSASARELGRGPVASVHRMDTVSSVPGTDSLFSLLPSVEPQSIIAPFGGAGNSHQQQPSRMIDSRTGSQALAWQGERAARANGSASALGAERSGGRLAGAQLVDTASSSMRLSMRETRSTNPTGDSEAEAVDSKGVDVVVRGGRDGNGGFTPDYLKAVQSAAQRTLLPRSRVQSGSSVRGGGDCQALLNSGWAAVAAASNSATTQLSATAKVGGSDGEEPRSAYEGYVMLPIPSAPQPPVAPTGSGELGLPLPLAMHSTSSVAAATAAVVRKCLDKGFPFAVIPVKHFTAVMGAAEQHDGPLAHHIISTHGVYYPGVGRHAASSGGGAFAVAGVAVAGFAWGSGSSSGAKATAAATQSKSTATTAAATAAAIVRQLLATGDALHVMSPGEYQRMQLAAQYSLRELQKYLVAQPLVSATASAFAGMQSGSSSVAADRDSGPAAQAAGSLGGVGRVLRQHRRGSSICSESNFTTLVRFQSGLEGRGGPDSTATAVPGGAACSLSSDPDAALTSTPSSRVKALIQASQLGNMARVEYLLRHGADVNDVEGASPQHQAAAQGVRGRTALHYAALSGSFGVAQLLMYHGAFVGVRDGTGRTAYDLARRKGHGAVAQLLREAAERRREVVQGGATIANVAPRPGYPPPVPPRSKQLRSNSAPASNAAMEGPLAMTGGVKAVAAVNTGSTDAAAGGAVVAVVYAPAACSSARDVRVLQPAGAGADGVVELVEYQLSESAPTAPGPTGGPSGPLAAAVQLPAAPSKEIWGSLVQSSKDDVGARALQAVDGAAATNPEPGAAGDAVRVRGKWGLLSCFLCDA